MDTAPRRLRTLAPAVLGTLLLTGGLVLSGCASGGSGESADSQPATEQQAPVPEGDAGGQALDGSAQGRAAYDDGASARTTDVDAGPEPGSVAEPAIIQTGTMTVRSADVAEARFDLEKVVDAHAGSIADERTTATSEGDVRLSRLVLRIPSSGFDAAMDDLAALGEVTASTRKAQDVTGEVIDTRARIRAQEQSLARVEVLFGRAQDIRDIVAIEAQLSRRQAELDSLKGQLAYLEDQTTLSTITVYLEPEKPRAAEDDDSAFLGGLESGWHALATLGAGMATVSGALLPFAALALLLGVPAAVVARRWLARHAWRRPAAEA